nr:acyltransferase domain-containing protein [Actinomadura madurae]
MASKRSAPGVIMGEADPSTRVVFVFPGQGPQWAGMGAGMLASSAAFRESFAECSQALEEFVDWSPADAVTDAAGGPSLDDIEVIQPALYAVTRSLAAAWRAAGVESAAVVGHSIGEVAAADVAGGLPVASAARVIALWSRAQGTLVGRGGHGPGPAARRGPGAAAGRGRRSGRGRRDRRRRGQRPVLHDPFRGPPCGP